MRHFIRNMLAALGCIFSLSACSPFHPSDEQAGVCNEINSQIIFSGSTNITRDAEIQSAEKPLLQQSYDRRCVKGIADGG